MSEEKLVIVVGGKAIEIDERVVEVLRRYKRTQMTLEELASALGLDGWEEAYEFVKKVPAWVMDIEPSMWKTALKKHIEKSSSTTRS